MGALRCFLLFSFFSFSSFLSLHPFFWYCELTPRFAVLSWKWHLFKPPLYVLSFISQAHYLDKVVKGMAFLLPSILPSSLPPFLPFVTSADINKLMRTRNHQLPTNPLLPSNPVH